MVLFIGTNRNILMWRKYQFFSSVLGFLKGLLRHTPVNLVMSACFLSVCV